MSRRITVPEPDVASLLTDRLIAEAFERADNPIRGDAAWQFHAA
jgi:hypothetical protein